MKKMLSTFLTLMMLFNLSAIAFAAHPEYGEEYQNQPIKHYSQSFKDVNTDFWAFTYIAEMAEKEVLSGYPNGNFYPNNTVTRAEFAKIMCLAAGLTVNSVSSTSYDDVKASAWYAPFVERGKYYLSGYLADGKKYYKPDDKALREDIAVALVKLKGYDTSVYDESILKAMFADWQSISEGARKYVSVAIENGLISGYEDNTFRGQASITRAEAATLLWRAYQYGNGNKIFEKEKFDEPILSEKEQETVTELGDGPSYRDLEFSIENPTITINDGDKAVFTGMVFETRKSLKTNKVIEKKDLSLEDAEEFEIIVKGDTDIFYSDGYCLDNDYIEYSEVADGLSFYFQTKNLSSGKYNVILSIIDGNGANDTKITINVNEPEPEYTFELVTLEKNVEKDDDVIYAMIATEDSVVYLTHTECSGVFPGEKNPEAVGKEKIVEIKKDSSPEIITSSENIKYLGKEKMSKSDEARFKTYILSLGYNKYDKSPYAIIQQFAGNCGTKYYLYNLYTKEFNEVEKDEYIYQYVGDYWHRIFSMTSDGEIFSNIGFSFQGSRNSINSNNDGNGAWRPVVIDDKLFVGMYYFDNRTGEWKQLDYYVPGYARYISSNSENLYFVDSIEKIIYIVDSDGNYDTLCTFDDIDNIDGKVINMECLINGRVPMVAIDDDGTIYYLDYDHNSIRQLSEK